MRSTSMALGGAWLRLTTLARPGGIVVLLAICRSTGLGVDADLEDLGYCYLKHPERGDPRVLRDGSRRGVEPAAAAAAVATWPDNRGAPFSAAGERDRVGVIGEALADSVIGQLSASRFLGVISRLSTSALRARSLRALEIGKLLGCTFIVSGTYRESGDNLSLSIELTDAKGEQVIWSEEFAGRKTEVLSIQSELTQALCTRIVEALLHHEIRRVSTRPLPTLEAFELQLTGAMLMHHASRANFERGRELLEHLLERYPRAATSSSVAGQVVCLRVSRGFVQDMRSESARALDHTHRALDNSPDCSLALAVEGFVHCHMLRDLDTADQKLDQALALNPNDSLAWIFKCATLTFRGSGREALQAGRRAIALSPIDPMKHYYDGLMSSAAVAANRTAARDRVGATFVAHESRSPANAARLDDRPG